MRNLSTIELLNASESSSGEFGDQKITGGSEIQMGFRPWMVLLQLNLSEPNERLSFACGGTLISPLMYLVSPKPGSLG